MRPEQSVIDAYRRDGFVNLGRFFSDEQVTMLRSELERYLDAAFRGRDSDVTLPWLHQDMSNTASETLPQFVNIWEVSEPFRRVATDARIGEALSALASANELQIFTDQLLIKPSHSGGAMTWHQDAPYWLCIEPPIMLSAWIALDDADTTNGCMWMVPGSHEWGFAGEALGLPEWIRELDGFDGLPEKLPEGARGAWRKPQPCPVRRGEVHVHHCLTWHGSPVNRSGRPRRAFVVHYMPTGVRFSGAAEHPLARNIRIPAGAPMLEEDVAHFPIVWRQGRGA